MRPRPRRAAAIMSGTEAGGEEVPLAFTPTTILPPAPHEAFTRAKPPDVPSRAFFTLVRCRIPSWGREVYCPWFPVFVTAAWGWGVGHDVLRGVVRHTGTCAVTDRAVLSSQLVCLDESVFGWRRLCICVCSRRTLLLPTMVSTQPGVATPLHARRCRWVPSRPPLTLFFRATQRWQR